MGYTWKGQQGLITKWQTTSFDPAQGHTLTAELWGTQVACEGLVLQYSRRAGGRGERAEASQVEGPVWRVNVQLPLTTVVSTDWECTTELIEKDLFESPAVAADAALWTNGPRAYRTLIEEGDVDTIDDMVAKCPLAVTVSNKLARGITGWETEYQVVRRTRRGAYQYPFNRTIYQAKYVYSTAQIGMPGNLAFSFASLFPQPSDTIQGWRLRTQQFSLVDTRWEEVVEWALANWDSMLYEAAPGAFV